MRVLLGGEGGIRITVHTLVRYFKVLLSTLR